MIKRQATAQWRGTGSAGTGRVRSATAIPERTLSFRSRFEGADVEAGTTPEELLAAAHASCYAMSLGQALEVAGLEAERLDVQATVTLRAIEGGVEISRVHLSLDAAVPGADTEALKELAEAAKVLCPVSMALHAVPVTLDVTLA